jgi:hypothetical protein
MRPWLLQDGRTALHYAAGKGCSITVTHLLAKAEGKSCVNKADHVSRAMIPPCLRCLPPPRLAAHCLADQTPRCSRDAATLRHRCTMPTADDSDDTPPVHARRAA